MLGTIVLLLICAVFAATFALSGKEETKYEALPGAEISAIYQSNEGLSDKCQTVIEAGVSLIGKVHYFWGGKSSSIGWDEKWGTPMKVTGEGSETTGTTRPYGLDCSGFVTWCFIQSGYTPSEADELIGNGTWNQWDKSTENKWEDLRPGDLVFQNAYPTNQGNHIGICIGYDDNDEPVFVHCAASFDNVVVTNAGSVFKYARRPSVFR